MSQPTEFPTNIDVLVIGAGAAGLGAAKKLTKAGKSVLIIEAADRIGGRAWTDTETFGVPVDMGCSWISGSKKNKFTKIARKHGFTLVDHTDVATALFVDGRKATEDELDAYDAAGSAVEKALKKAGKKGKDLPASDVIPMDMPFLGAAKAWMGPMDYGMDYNDISTLCDYMSDNDQPSFIVTEGLGAVVATLGTGLPVSLNTSANVVDWSGSGVSVETNRGTIKADKCVVTVSTGVLASGAIKFVPELPEQKQTAIHDLPMGLLIKVPMLFDGARLGLNENEWMSYDIPDGQTTEACFFITWPCGHDYVFGNIGGQFGWDLYSQGNEAVVQFALEEMIKQVGSDARKHFIKGLATDWAENPLTQGAYSALKPGRYGARKVLAEPLGDRVYFAGEAMGKTRSALVNGALESGYRAAKKVLKSDA